MQLLKTKHIINDSYTEFKLKVIRYLFQNKIKMPKELFVPMGQITKTTGANPRTTGTFVPVVIQLKYALLNSISSRSRDIQVFRLSWEIPLGGQFWTVFGPGNPNP